MVWQVTKLVKGSNEYESCGYLGEILSMKHSNTAVPQYLGNAICHIRTRVDYFIHELPYLVGN